VFRAATRLLLNGGLANITLKHVAARVGVSYQAVAQRFESKEGLLRAYFEWFGVVVTEDAQAIIAEESSSAARLKQLLTLPIDPRLFDADTFEQQASWTLISLELRREPALEPIIAEQVGLYSEFLTGVVREGQEKGEFAPGNPEDIAELALAAGTGAAMQWLFNQREPLLVKMERCIDLAIRPYLNRPE
jgi:AcrR family transcriptional regulator